MTAPTTNRRGLAVALVVALVALRVLALVVLLVNGVDKDNSILGGDARRYDAIMHSEGTPYRDFEVEYPPVTLGLISLIETPTLHDALTRLGVSQLLLELAVAGLLAWAFSRRTAIVYLVLGTPTLFFPFPYMRTDLLSVFLAIGGLALLRKGWERTGGAGLAIAVFAKLWPLVVAPVLLVERKVRATTAWAAAGLAGLMGWILWVGTDGITQNITFRGSKGWQIESFPGLVIHALHPHDSLIENGAWRTSVAVPGWGRPVMGVLSVAVVIAAWWLAGRRRRRGADDTGSYALAPLASVLALLVFSPIISPQYVLWLVPFAAIAAARGDRWIGGLTLGITALTTYSLATIHAQIEGRLHAMIPLFGRNVLLVVLMALAIWRLASSPAGEAPLTDDETTPVAVTASPSA